jgi:hypothetical protein
MVCQRTLCPLGGAAIPLLISRPGRPLTPHHNLCLLNRLCPLGAGVSLMVYISPSLAMIMLSIVPPLAAGAVAYGGFVRRVAKRTQDALAGATQVAEERCGPRPQSAPLSPCDRRSSVRVCMYVCVCVCSCVCTACMGGCRLSGIRTVRAFAQEATEATRYARRPPLHYAHPCTPMHPRPSPTERPCSHVAILTRVTGPSCADTATACSRCTTWRGARLWSRAASTARYTHAHTHTHTHTLSLPPNLCACAYRGPG